MGPVEPDYELEDWQIAEIEQGLKEADAGDFASDEEMETTFRES